MRGSRICEFEKWLTGGVRPSVRTLKILADIYETTWDRLVDVDDLEEMPARDRQAFLDISDLRYGDSLDLPVPRQGNRRPTAPHGGDDPRVDRLIVAVEPATVRERLTVPAPGRSGSGLPGEVTYFTGRDRSMAELRAQITEQAPQGTVVSIYASDGMAGVGKTAFARHAAQVFAPRYPDGGIWVDLFGHTPGMQPREASGALEQVTSASGPTSAIFTAKPWPSTGTSVIGAVRSTHCGGWAMSSGSSESTARPASTTLRR